MFRGKRLDNSEWIYGYYVFDEFKGENGATGIAFTNDPCGFQVVEVDPNTVGQYSVITDRKNTKIYKGDILTAPDIKGYKPCEVKFGIHNIYINGWYVEWADGLQAELNNSWQDSGEIIGDIYNNSELLN